MGRESVEEAAVATPAHAQAAAPGGGAGALSWGAMMAVRCGVLAHCSESVIRSWLSRLHQVHQLRREFTDLLLHYRNATVTEVQVNKLSRTGHV